MEQLLFVEISLERGKDNPQRIFESLNSTGLELTQADLIRNYILMRLPYSKQVYIFNYYWNIIENNTKENKTQKNKVYEEFKKRYKKGMRNFIL